MFSCTLSCLPGWSLALDTRSGQSSFFMRRRQLTWMRPHEFCITFSVCICQHRLVYIWTLSSVFEYIVGWSWHWIFSRILFLMAKDQKMTQRNVKIIMHSKRVQINLNFCILFYSIEFSIVRNLCISRQTELWKIPFSILRFFLDEYEINYGEFWTIGRKIKEYFMEWTNQHMLGTNNSSLWVWDPQMVLRVVKPRSNQEKHKQNRVKL